jgi:hypothetical protein
MTITLVVTMMTLPGDDDGGGGLAMETMVGTVGGFTTTLIFNPAGAGAAADNFKCERRSGPIFLLDAEPLDLLHLPGTS